MNVCRDLGCDASTHDLVQMTRNMLEKVGVPTTCDTEEVEKEWLELGTSGTSESEFWEEVLASVDHSRLTMTMESHVHELSDEDFNESDLSRLPLEMIDWLKLNRESDEKEEEEEKEAVEIVEKTFHFQQMDSNNSTWSSEKLKSYFELKSFASES